MGKRFILFILITLTAVSAYSAQICIHTDSGKKLITQGKCPSGYVSEHKTKKKYSMSSQTTSEILTGNKTRKGRCLSSCQSEQINAERNKYYFNYEDCVSGCNALYKD